MVPNIKSFLSHTAHTAALICFLSTRPDIKLLYAEGVPKHRSAWKEQVWGLCIMCCACLFSLYHYFVTAFYTSHSYLQVCILNSVFSFYWCPWRNGQAVLTWLARNKSRWLTHLQMVIHLSTNWAWCTVTLLFNTNEPNRLSWHQGNRKLKLTLNTALCLTSQCFHITLSLSRSPNTELLGITGEGLYRLDALPVFKLAASCSVD